jgi:hypothetical protein
VKLARCSKCGQENPGKTCSECATFAQRFEHWKLDELLALERPALARKMAIAQVADTYSATGLRQYNPPPLDIIRDVLADFEKRAELRMKGIRKRSTEPQDPAWETYRKRRLEWQNRGGRPRIGDLRTVERDVRVYTALIGAWRQDKKGKGDPKPIPASLFAKRFVETNGTELGPERRQDAIRLVRQALETRRLSSRSVAIRIWAVLKGYAPESLRKYVPRRKSANNPA